MRMGFTQSGKLVIRILWLVAIGLAGGCDRREGPTAPDEPGTSGPGSSARALSLTAGTYLLELTGYALSYNPDIQPCQPIGIPRAGTDLLTTVDLASEGDEWVGRSTASSGGTIELRFRDAGVYLTGGEVLVGSLAGSASDLALFRSARDVRIAIRGAGGSSAADLTGAAIAGPFLFGRASGAIELSDSTGAMSSCPSVSWTLQRLPEPTGPMRALSAGERRQQ